MELSYTKMLAPARAKAVGWLIKHKLLQQFNLFGAFHFNLPLSLFKLFLLFGPDSHEDIRG